MRSLRAFLLLSRPHFLVGGALMFALGASLADGVDLAGYLLGQAMVTAAQVTAHYVNEYADLEADRTVSRRTLFSGGSGVLVSGELVPAVAIRAAGASSVLAVGLAAVVATRSLVAALLGLAALGVSWAYSMPPLRLLGTGYGELATSLVVTVVVPLIGISVQEAPLVADLWWAVAVLLPIHIAMMLAFELPDLESDAAAGKRGLAVRIGRDSAVWMITGLLIVAGLVAAVGGTSEGFQRAAVAVTYLGLPPAVVTVEAIRRDKTDLLTAAAVATLVMVGGAFVAVFA
jgi:1,4-dihydroxy-2-naphthoate octaprenyltransferase